MKRPSMLVNISAPTERDHERAVRMMQDHDWAVHVFWEMPGGSREESRAIDGMVASRARIRALIAEGLAYERALKKNKGGSE